ncbi:SpoVG family protein [bacterium]|nr:SpoVG family protein [bacterium]
MSLGNEDKLKAFVNVTFDDSFVVRGMKVIKGSNGYFISMPSRKMPDGSYRDIAHPIRNEFRQYIEEEILSEYQKSLQDEGVDITGELGTAELNERSV